MIFEKSTLRILLLKAFDIRQGEVRIAGLMQLLIFLIISTLLVLKPTSNALFINKFGVEQLPFAFILVAAVAGVTAGLYSRGLSRFSLYAMFSSTLISSIGLLVITGVAFHFGLQNGFVLYAFYVGVAIFAVLTASQFWILANMVFDVRQAKRLFGFIGAGAIAGGIFGGYFTSVLSNYLNSERLVYVAVFQLLIALPIVRYVWKNYVIGAVSPPRQPKKANSTKSPLLLILESKHLSYMAAIIALGVVVAKLVDYQFSAIAADRISDQDELTGFFGFWFSTFNVVSLFIQLLITRRIVGNYGVGIALFVLPIGILIGAMILLILPGLAAAILIKMADGSLKQSIHKAAIELLAIPIPNEIKKQTKTYIDVAVDSLATGLGGLILIFLVRGLDLSTTSITVMIIILIGVWLYFAQLVKKEYFLSFKLKTKSARQRDLSRVGGFSKDGWDNALIYLLENGSDRQILLALKKIRRGKTSLNPAFLSKLLDHQSPSVRAAVIKTLDEEDYENMDQKVEEEIEEEIADLTNDPSIKVREQAFKFLLSNSEEDIVPVLQKFLKDKNLKMSSAALVGLAMDCRENPSKETKERIEQEIEKRLGKLEKEKHPRAQKIIKKGILKAIGYAQVEKYYHFIRESLNEKDEEIVRLAIRTAGYSLDARFLNVLVDALPHYKNSARVGLQLHGDDLIDILDKKVNNPQTRPRILRCLPPVLMNMATQKAVHLLLKLLEHPDEETHYSALKALNKMRRRYTHFDFEQIDVARHILEEAKIYQNTLALLYAQTTPIRLSLPEPQMERIKISRLVLISVLEKRLDDNLERIFWLLGLKYAPEDVFSIYQGIRSNQPYLRSNAVEFLDNLLEFNLKKVLIPLIETTLLDTISIDAVEKLRLSIPSEYDCLEALLKLKDRKLNLIVLDLICALENRAYRELVSRATKKDNFKVKRRASEILREWS